MTDDLDRCTCFNILIRHGIPGSSTVLNTPWLRRFDVSQDLDPFTIREVVKIFSGTISCCSTKYAHHPFSQHDKRRNGHNDKYDELL